VLTLTDTNGTPFALTTADPVIVGIWHTILGPNVKQVTFDVPHFERCNGVLGVSASGVEIKRPLFGANVFRGAYLVQSCQQWEMKHPGSAGDLAAGGIVFHQANDANNSRNQLTGPVQFSGTLGGTAQKLIQADGGSYCSYVRPPAIVNIAANYTVAQNDSDITVDAGGASRTITLPAPVNTVGMRVRIKRIDGSLTNLVTITSAAGNIDGQTNAYLTGQYQTIELENDGTNWQVLAGNRIPRILHQNGELSTVSAADVSIDSFSLPGGSLVGVGQAVRLTMRGIASGGTATLNIKFGATVVLTGTVAIGNAYDVDVIVSRSGAAVQRAVGLLDNGTAIGVNSRTGPTETLANAILIDFRGSITAGTLTADMVEVEYLSTS